MKRHALRQAGAAILIAMLTVALVATFAAAALWQQWRSVEVESAERTRVQSSWILAGALDWARLVLREDVLPPNSMTDPDTLNEPWAVPLQEARLSSFLAADKNNTVADTTGDVLDAFLSGQIIDAQSMLNANALVSNGKPNPPVYDAFAKLFDLLGLPQAQLEKLTNNLRFAQDQSAANLSGPQAPLIPQRFEQLAWLGVPPATLSVLQPYVTVLPTSNTTVNINTAPAEVIYAAIASMSMADAQAVVLRRASTPYRDVSEIAASLGKPASFAPAGQGVDVKTQFFEVRARLRLDTLVVEERSLVERAGPQDIAIIWRERGVVDPTRLAQAR